MRFDRTTLLNIALIVIFGLALTQAEAYMGDYQIYILKLIFINAILALSLNLIYGFTGLFSLGHAGFMAIGAYVGALCTLLPEQKEIMWILDPIIWPFSVLHTPFWVAVIAGGLVAMIFAFIIAVPVLRLGDDYLGIATLGFAEIIRAIFQWDRLGPVTNGANALKSFPTFSSFNIENANGEVVLRLSTFVPFLLVAVCIGIMVLLINSTYGRAFKAIRDDEIAAEAMGINLARHKMISFVVSSFFCGVAGAMLAMCNTSVSSVSFTTSMTYQILLVVVVGGIGSVSGSIIAAFIYYASSEWWLRFLDLETYTAAGTRIPLLGYGFRMVVFSVLIMIVVLFFRKGIMGTREVSVYDDVRAAGRFFRKLFGGKAAKGGAA